VPVPRDFIDVDTSTTVARYAPDLLQLRNAVRDVIERASKLKGIMDHNTAAGDFTDIERLFGLGVGEGTLVYGFVSGMLQAMRGNAQNNDTVTFSERVG
jgi:hypothetical protein